MKVTICYRASTVLALRCCEHRCGGNSAHQNSPCDPFHFQTSLLLNWYHVTDLDPVLHASSIPPPAKEMLEAPRWVGSYKVEGSRVPRSLEKRTPPPQIRFCMNKRFTEICESILFLFFFCRCSLAWNILITIAVVLFLMELEIFVLFICLFVCHDTRHAAS